MSIHVAAFLIIYKGETLLWNRMKSGHLWLQVIQCHSHLKVEVSLYMYMFILVNMLGVTQA
jgi:hypothetical protein